MALQLYLRLLTFYAMDDHQHRTSFRSPFPPLSPPFVLYMDFCMYLHVAINMAPQSLLRFAIRYKGAVLPHQFCALPFGLALALLQKSWMNLMRVLWMQGVA